MNMIKEWPPCQVFYIESMLTICESVRSSYEMITIKQKDQILYNFGVNDYLDQFQNIIQQAAALSRYFWPSYNKDQNKNEIFQKRGEYLREYFDMSENNPLKNRELRNAIEHFDEKLDLYLQKPIAGEFFPNYVGKKPDENHQNCKFFRAYFTDTEEFEVLGKKFHVVLLINEIIRIYNHLIVDNETGGVLNNPVKKTI